MRTLIFTLTLMVLLPTVSHSQGLSSHETESGDTLGMNCPRASHNAYAQVDSEEGAMPPYGPGPRPGHGMEPGKGRKHLEGFRLRKALELLNLDKNTEAKFSAAFCDYRQGQWKLRREKMRTIDTLARGLRSGEISDDETGRLTTKVDDLDRQILQLTDEFTARIKSLLTAEQLGKLYVFEARFDQEVFQQVARSRRGLNMPPPEGPIELEPDQMDIEQDSL